ncbi:hypothetical protein B0J13DRAFT_562844 [Dactylonectria estremocensis]|uniref:Uncharacterized protein n=1 Tax=Dactylonectria estremocensis TaxID=1079267 RepID=A0A9P9E5Q0_9HYPO|nr:hypothetical protein B0J13DRAFT_562844 [Dactylonectria estremocensis]
MEQLHRFTYGLLLFSQTGGLMWLRLSLEGAQLRFCRTDNQSAGGRSSSRVWGSNTKSHDPSLNFHQWPSKSQTPTDVDRLRMPAHGRPDMGHGIIEAWAESTKAGHDRQGDVHHVK